MRLVILVLLLSNLTACALFERKPETAIVVPNRVVLNSESFTPCTKLKEFNLADNDMSPFITLLETIKENAIAYSDCAKKQENSIILLRKFSNIQEAK